MYGPTFTHFFPNPARRLGGSSVNILQKEREAKRYLAFVSSLPRTEPDRSQKQGIPPGPSQLSQGIYLQESRIESRATT